MSEHAGVVEPVVKKVEVAVPPDQAFALFTIGMGQWWPLETQSIAADTHGGRVKAESLTFEGRVGGDIYETMSDGSKGAWGKVLTWEPPRRVTFSWKPNLSEGPFTEIEVRFTELGAGTEVELVHRGWERFGASAHALRGGYDSGWPGVLGRFRSAAPSPSLRAPSIE